MKYARRGSWAEARAQLTLVTLLALCACKFVKSKEDDGNPPRGQGGSSSLGEICDNGVDDDDDGDVDCADVSCSARAPDPSAPTGFADSVAWLYQSEGTTGCAPPQAGVSTGALDPARLAVMRGLVSDDQGIARAGVRVGVVGAPELGSVTTRADGMFDIAVNGGRTVTLELRDPEFLRVHRRAQVPVSDYAWVEPVVLKRVSTQVTSLSLGASSSLQVMRAEPSADSSGPRRPTLLFPAQTQASLQNADGSTSPLTNLNVRLTEYTVGERGPQAMPADLPPASGYTYAFELSVDEAEAAGATGVTFDKPVPLYMENFLGFPTGTPVPVGYYDRETATWQPAEDGVVLAILAEAEGRAALDLDGDAVAETAAELATFGIAPEELENLANLYEPGQSLWRTAATHFSLFDHNWPFGFPLDAIDPPLGELEDGSTDTPACASGSIIRVDNRTLGESLSIAGTGYSLFYQSDRTPGGQSRRVDVAVSEKELPPTLKRIETTLEIAGQQQQGELAAAPDQRFVYDWDGLNAYGFPIQGSQPFLLRVGYVYDGIYTTSERSNNPRSFGQPGSIRLEGNRTREEVTSVREIRGLVGGWDARGQGLAGFTLDVHHVYDPKGHTLFLGDGSERTSETVPLSLVDVLAEFEATPDQVLAHPDGRVFITEDTNGGIYQFAAGQLTLFAGGGTPAEGVGDGGPATQAVLTEPQGMALGPDGSLYVAEGTRIRRIAPDGIISTFAGGGGGSFVEGESATASDFSTVDSLAFGSDGSLYAADLYGHRVFRIAPDNTITTFAGSGRTSGDLGDGGPATLALVNEPSGVAFGPDGSLYISEREGNRIRRVTTDGVISTVAGTGVESSTGDGGPATQATLDTPRAIAFDTQGNLLISEEGTDRVREIGADGLITTLLDAESSDGRLEGPDGIATSADGSVYVVSVGALLRIAPSLPNTSLSDLSVASADGSELYRFDRLGKHLSTLDTLTAAELRRFDYDAAGRLTTVTEEGRRTTRIERGNDGQPTAIVSPYGVRTGLEVNTEGFLAKVSDALGQSVALEYAPGGLLTKLIDERGGAHVFAYENGRLVSDQDPSGATQTLSQETLDGAQVVTRTTPLGRSIRHIRQRSADGGLEQRIESPTGAVSTTVRDPNGNLTASLPDGTQIVTSYGPDPRFGAMAPLNRQTVVTLPSGLTSTISQTRAAELLDADNPLSLVRLTNETRMNDRVFLSEYDAASRTLVQTSPAGRQVTSVLDAEGRLLEVRAPGLLSTFYEYDADGRLVGVVSGEGNDVRRIDVEHTADGWVGSVTDALGQSTSYTHDAVGRATSYLYADGTSASFAYDAAGQPTALTPPGQAAHGLEYDVRGLPSAYGPPELASGATPTSYVYDADRRLTSVALPGLAPISYSYDAAGQLSGVAHAGGSLTLAYDAAERLIESQSPDGVTLAYAYDGSLPTSTTWSGAVAGSVSRTYDENFFVTALAVNGTSVAYQYDDDGVVTRAGALQLTRDATNGLLTASSVGNLDDVFTYTPRGELASHSVTSGATAVYAANYTRDVLGRIATSSESIAGATTSNAYTYDAVGQLVEVSTDGTISAAYTYDPDGNRLSVTARGVSVSGSHDAQERLLSFGDSAYAYTPRGTLESRITAGATTQYTYDPLGNLSAVTLPDARTISYLTDAENRRVAKLVDGAIQRAWLYQDALRPIAELDADGAVTSRFVYGIRANVPDLMLQGGVTYALIADLRGSVRLVVNASTGAVAQRIDYGPFGEVIADSAPGFQPFGFAGGLYDPDTGLVRFGARDYDPQIGRWLAKDPIGFRGGQSNLYGYVANDPVNRIDSTGQADIFFAFDLDLVGITGYEFGAGIVFDTDHPRESGVFVSAGPGAGANVGWGVAGGAVFRDVEGRGTDLDINSKFVSPVIYFDDEGFNGAAIGVGPGLGVSFSLTETRTYSVDDLLNDLRQLRSPCN